jgi:hypothetical protein
MFDIIKRILWAVFRLLFRRSVEKALATVTIKSAADDLVVGKIIASPGTKISEREFTLSYNTPAGFEPIEHYLGTVKRKKLKFPFWIFEDGIIYVLFTLKPEDIPVRTGEVDEVNEEPIQYAEEMV